MSSPDIALIHIIAHIQGRVMHEPVRTNVVEVVVVVRELQVGVGRVAAFLKHATPWCLQS